MTWLLEEHTPRPWTIGYGLHRLQAVVRVQAPILLPLAVGGLYAAAGTGLALRFGLTASLPAALAAGALAGLPALAGTAALWRWFSARLYPWIDTHPLPPWLVVHGYRLPPRPAAAEPAVVLGEHHPERRYSPSGEYELQPTTAERYSIVPEWVILPACGLVTGLLVLGSIGSGKTAYVLRPSIFKLFHHPSCPGGLVMDSKAALVEPLRAEMEIAGRAEDLLAVGPHQPTRWNPLHMPLSSPATIADSLLTTVENINGAPYGSDARWIRNGAAHLVEGAIGLLRLRASYVTASAVREFLALLMAAAAGSDTPGEVVAGMVAQMFAGSAAPTDHQEEYAHYSGLLISRMSEDEKFRAIYVSELLALLVPLTSPGVSAKFNSAEGELDMPSWSESINRGLVVVLDCNSRSQPSLAVALGMLLKLGYQNAMLARLDWVSQGLCNADRYMALLIDEYQDFASPGDSEYLALCRESKSITVVLTQGYASVVQRVGEERSKVILQSLRNRLILTQTVPEFSADLLGQAEITEVDRSISESMQDASLHATGKFAGQSSVSESLSVRRQRKHIVPPEDLAGLPTGQGILQGFDGEFVMPLCRVYLRPYFAPDIRHADLTRSKNA